MKHRIPFLATLLLATGLSIGSPAETAAPTFDQRFSAAQAAYDAGQMTEAIDQFKTMVDDGCRNTEVLYNLANAYFKNNDLPEAVWFYRHAWYTAPRDPDIQANLGFALNAANAVAPAPPLLNRLAEMLSSTEWIIAAVGSYIALTILLILAFLVRPFRRILFKLAILPGVLILVAAGGWSHWNQFAKSPEVVVVRSGATTLFGPIENSTAHYKMPPAALAQQTGTDPKGWIRIKYDGKEGWIKGEYVRNLYP